MSKCSYCGKVSLFAADKGPCLCKGCTDRFLPKISRCKEAIKRGFVKARYSEGDDMMLEGLEEVCGNARTLLRFEQAGVPTTNPPPSRILEAALERREELLYKQAHQPGSRNEMPPQEGDGEAGRHETPGACAATGSRSGKRKAERWAASFYTTVEPGGTRALVKDVSASGMFIAGPSSRTVGSRIKITLYTGRGNLQTEAVVRRKGVTSGKDRFAEQSGLGVQFLHPLPQLERFVSRRTKTPEAAGA